MNSYEASLRDVAVNWLRIGITGFGGPPTHIRLLRELCVTQKNWIDAEHFEDAVATYNLLPGPASTQLAIYSAWKVRGPLGGLIGGVLFIVPGLILILVLAALFISRNTPKILIAVGEGAGATVAAIAIQAAAGLLPSSWNRRSSRSRWLLYVTSGVVAAVLFGPYLVLILLACGFLELGWRKRPTLDRHRSLLLFVPGIPILAKSTLLTSLIWTALKIGALSYGGGFVIIPLMRGDAVSNYHWMTSQMFLSAVALGQITPGPVVQTVAVVGYSAAGIVGGVLAAMVAFAPSFVFVLVGARYFKRIRSNTSVRYFLDGAGPAAIGAIMGAALPLALSLNHLWQWALLISAAIALLRFKMGVVPVILSAGVLAGVGFYIGIIPL